MDIKMFNERSEWKMSNLRNCLSRKCYGADILAGAQPSSHALLSAFPGQPFFVLAFSLLTVQFFSSALSHSCALWVSSYFCCGSLAWVSVRSPLQWTTCLQWPFPWLTCWKLLKLAEFSWPAFQSVAWWFRGPDVKGFCSQTAWELVSATSQYVAFVECGGLVVPWPFLNDDEILPCWRVSTRFVHFPLSHQQGKWGNFKLHMCSFVVNCYGLTLFPGLLQWALWKVLGTCHYLGMKGKAIVWCCQWSLILTLLEKPLCKYFSK